MNATGFFVFWTLSSLRNKDAASREHDPKRGCIVQKLEIRKELDCGVYFLLPSVNLEFNLANLNTHDLLDGLGLFSTQRKLRIGI